MKDVCECLSPNKEADLHPPPPLHLSKDMKHGGCGLRFFIMSLFSGAFPLLLLLLFLSILLGLKEFSHVVAPAASETRGPAARRRWRHTCSP